jgi:trimeric autotransporter adhesin
MAGMPARRFKVAAFVLAAVCVSAATACSLLNSLDGFSDGPASTEPVDSGAGDEIFTSREAGGDGSPEMNDAGRDAIVPLSRYPAAVLADKPILYFRFGETNGAPAKDEVTGATFPYPVSGGKFGTPGALAGDSNTSITLNGNFRMQVNVPVDFEGNVPFSVEAWASPTTDPTGIGFIVDHESWTSRHGWLLGASHNNIGFERWMLDGGSSSMGTAEQAVNGKWHHIVMSSDGTIQRLYVDNVLRTSSQAGVPLMKIGEPWSIGGQNCQCSSNSFYGSLDELAIYGHALTEERISAHFDAGR